MEDMELQQVNVETTEEVVSDQTVAVATSDTNNDTNNDVVRTVGAILLVGAVGGVALYEGGKKVVKWASNAIKKGRKVKTKTDDLKPEESEIIDVESDETDEAN